MQNVMGTFLNGMQYVAARIPHPINSFTYRIGRQLMILNMAFGFVFLLLVDLRFQILALGLLLILLFVLSIECLLKPRPSHLTRNDPFAIGMVRIFLQ